MARSAVSQANEDRKKAQNEAAFTKFNETLARAGDKRAAGHLSKQGRSVITVNVGPHQRSFIDKVPDDIARQLSAVNTDQSGNQFNNFSIERVTQPGDFPGEVKRSSPGFGRASAENPRGAETVKDRLFRERKERDDARKAANGTLSPEGTTPDFQNKNGLESVTGQGISQTPEKKSIATTSLIGPAPEPAPLPQGFQQSGIGANSGAIPQSTNLQVIPKSAAPTQNNIIGPVQLGSFIGPVRPAEKPTTIIVTQGGGQQEAKPLSPISQGLQGAFNFLDDAQVSTGPARLKAEGITPQSDPVQFFGKSTLNSIIGAPAEVGKSVVATGIAIRNLGTQTIQPAITGKAPQEGPITVRGTTVADATFPVTFEDNKLGTKSPQAIASDSQKFIQERGPSAFVGGVAFDYVLPGAQASIIARQGIKKGAPAISKFLTQTPKSGAKIGDSVTTTVRTGSPSTSKIFQSGDDFKPATRANEIDLSPDTKPFGFTEKQVPLGKGATRANELPMRLTPKKVSPVKPDPDFKPARRANEIDLTQDNTLAGFTSKNISLGKGISSKGGAIPKSNPFTSTKVNLGKGIGQEVPRGGSTGIGKGFGGFGPGGGKGPTGGAKIPKGFKETKTGKGLSLLTKQKPVTTPKSSFKQFPVQLGEGKLISTTRTKIGAKVKATTKQATKTKTRQKQTGLVALTGVASQTTKQKQTGVLISKVVSNVKARPKLVTKTKKRQKQSLVAQSPLTGTKQASAFATTPKTGQKQASAFATPTTPLTRTSTLFATPPGPRAGPAQIFAPVPPPPVTQPILPPFPPLGGGGGRRPRKGGRRKTTGLITHAVFNPLGGSFSISEGKRGRSLSI